MKIALIFCKIDHIFSEYPFGALSIFESNPPLGLGSVATIASKRGHHVVIIDQQLSGETNETVSAIITDLKPDLVGFSCTSLNINNSVNCAALIMQKANCQTFAGGIHVTMRSEQLNRRAVFDFLISGEGEEVFNSILECIEQNSPLSSLNSPGFTLNGSCANVKPAVLSNINTPIVDRTLLNINQYRNRGATIDNSPCHSLYTSRGCPYTCRFCSKPDYFRLYRKRQVQDVIIEIKVLIKEFGTKALSFREDNLTADLNGLSSLCQMMKEEFNGQLPWECESRAELSRDTLALMYEAGCRGIWCGIETIVPRWQQWLNKILPKDTVRKFYDDCQDIGIKTGALFMFGFPEQTSREIEEDVEFAISLQTQFSAFQCLALFPGSLLTDYYHASGLYHRITDDVSIALSDGKSWREMLHTEKQINQLIYSSRS
jgi:radical SAM superfamily enzyme YgiQ (UPF0313 family)